MRKYYFISLLALIVIQSCYDKKSVVASISEYNIVECEFVGFAGSRSAGYKNFKRLKSIASKKELQELLKHDSLAVVTYASFALLDKGLMKPSELIINQLESNEYIGTFCGCSMSSETLASLIYHRYWNSRIEYPEYENYDNYILNESKELIKIDSLILYSNNQDGILVARAFENRIYSNSYRDIIEKRAFDKNEFHALKYVFNNLRKGNEGNLNKSFNLYLNDPTNYESQKGDVIRMKNELNNSKR